MYNVENLIIETLESIAVNSCNFEVLVIDDGSADHSLEKANNFIKDDIRFKIISQENQGVSVARNLGLSLASGEYICFVDSDDLLMPYALDKLLKAAKENKADFVYGKIKRKNSVREWYIDAHLRHNIFLEGEKSLKTNPELIYFIGVAGKLIHRSLINNSGFPLGMKFSEDTVVMYQAFLKAKKIWTIPELIYFYRERDLDCSQASATQQKDTKAFIYLKDSLTTMDICRNETLLNNLITHDEKIFIIKKYYDRFFSYEVWPLFIKVLKNDKKNINKALLLFEKFIENHSDEFVNEIATIRFFFIKVLIDKIYLFRIQDFKSLRRVLALVFKKLNTKVSAECAKKSVYGSKWDESYTIAFSRVDKAFIYYNLIRSKKYIYGKIKNDPKFIREKLFPILSNLPVNKNKIVFATTRKKPMSSNFDEVYKKIKLKENLVVYKFLGESNSIKTIFSRYYHLATANIIFLEDYYKPIYGLKFNKSTKIVQLWHACGAFKKFSFEALGLDDSHSIEFENNAHGSYSNVITSSNKLNEIYSKSFNIHLNQVIACGIPRTDIYFNEIRLNKIKNKINKKYPEFNKTINVLYAPTFRGNSNLRSKFILNLDWEMIAANFPNNYRLIIKLHPSVKEIYPPIPSFLKDRVTLLSPLINVDEMMIYTDILVTDYSSLIFEYSLLNKPIIYYPYDIDDYYNERGFYFEYESYVYGDVVYNTNDLIVAIKNAYLNKPLYMTKKQNFRDLFMSNCDGKATHRLVNIMLEDD
jgi:CDP-ribitol ribitolphosphotransferase / teichoic acid ribitol-phosphate polymerase